MSFLPALRPEYDDIAQSHGNNYMSQERVGSVERGDHIDILCNDGFNYRAEVKHLNKGIVHIHFPYWSKRYDYQGPLALLYIAPDGEYSSASVRNRYIMVVPDEVSRQIVAHTSDSHTSANSSGGSRGTLRFQLEDSRPAAEPSLSSRKHTTIESVDADIESFQESIKKLNALIKESRVLKRQRELDIAMLKNVRENLLIMQERREADRLQEPTLSPNQTTRNAPIVTPIAPSQSSLMRNGEGITHDSEPEDTNDYIVDRILEHRGNPNRRISLEFLVRWTGYDPSYDLWLPYSSVKDLEALDRYMQDHPELRCTKDSSLLSGQNPAKKQRRRPSAETY